MGQSSVTPRALEEKPHSMLLAELPIGKAGSFWFWLELPGEGIGGGLGKRERVKFLDQNHSLRNHPRYARVRPVVPRHMDVAIGRSAYVAHEVVTNIVKCPSAIPTLEGWSRLEARRQSSSERNYVGQPPSRRNSCTSWEGGSASPLPGRCRSHSPPAESSLGRLLA